jgi:enamine deaminase RidA (YjgF/YER057c/UK114 family)
MPKKEVIQVNLAAANPNLSPATRFGNLVFVAGQTGRHPVSGEVGKGVREQTHYALSTPSSFPPTSRPGPPWK